MWQCQLISLLTLSLIGLARDAEAIVTEIDGVSKVVKMYVTDTRPTTRPVRLWLARKEIGGGER
jgi:hypothetical protein